MINEVNEILKESASLEREYLELIQISDEMNLSAEIHDKLIMGSIAHSLAVIADALADRKTEPQTENALDDIATLIARNCERHIIDLNGTPTVMYRDVDVQRLIREAQEDCPHKEYPCAVCDEQTDCSWK